MKRAAMFLVGMLVALAVGFVAGRARGADTRAAELAAIERLHQADVAATLSQDPSYLTKLWSADGINLGFGGAPVVGLKDMGEAYAKFRAQYPEFKVLKYAPELKQIEIADGWALEIVAGDAQFQMSAKDAPVAAPASTGMRLLKRQPDGSWKFALVGMK